MHRGGTDGTDGTEGSEYTGGFPAERPSSGCGGTIKPGAIINEGPANVTMRMTQKRNWISICQSVSRFQFPLSPLFIPVHAHFLSLSL